MIEDVDVLQEVQRQWASVSELRDKIQRNLFAAPAVGGGTYPMFAADCAHNVPFLHACSVFNEVLLQLRDEGLFSSRSNFLGALVKAARHELPWIDYASVVEAVNKRNELAHKSNILPRAECARYLAVLDRQLQGWSVIP